MRLGAGTTKNGQGRIIYVGDNAALTELLRGAWAEHEALKAKGTICPWVFQRGGTRIKNIDDAWRGACTRAGHPGRLMHDLRRSAVRNLVRAGVAESVAMKITGHKTRSVFDRYNITSGNDIRAGLGAVGTNRGDKQARASNGPA